MHNNSVYFLFCRLNCPLTFVSISQTLHSFTLEKLRVGLPCSLHQQLIVFITSWYQIFFESHSILTGTEEQLGHSAKMDQQHYGLNMSFLGQIDYNMVLRSAAYFITYLAWILNSTAQFMCIDHS
jgi:hypothetical protein